MDDRLAWQIRLTGVYCISFIGLAIPMSIPGPTLAGLANILGEPYPTQLAPMLAARGLGIALGTAAVGPLLDKPVFARRSNQFLAAVAISMSLSIMVIPLATGLGLPYLCAGMALTSIMAGILDSGGNILLVRAWGDDSGGEAAMNILQFAWGIGAILAPIIASRIGLTAAAMPKVYLTVGACSLVLGLFPLLVHSPMLPTECRNRGMAGSGDDRSAKQQQRRKVCGLVSLCVFYFCYAGAEQMPGDWLTMTTRSTIPFGSDRQGAFATSLFWAGLTFGRLFAALAAAIRSNSELLVLGLAIASTSCMCLLSRAGSSLWGLAVSSIGMGAGLAPLFGCGLLLASSRFRMTGTDSSLILFGGAIGQMILPTLAGMVLHTFPFAMPWAELTLLGVQVLMVSIVLCMPRAQDVSTQPGSADGQSAPLLATDGVL